MRTATPESLIPKSKKPVASTSTLPFIKNSKKSKRSVVPIISPEELAATESRRIALESVSVYLFLLQFNYAY